jgi:hypothetical protein
VRDPFQIDGIGLVAGFVVLAEGFVSGLEHGVDVVPFVLGWDGERIIPQLELVGRARGPRAPNRS